MGEFPSTYYDPFKLTYPGGPSIRRPCPRWALDSPLLVKMCDGHRVFSGVLQNAVPSRFVDYCITRALDMRPHVEEEERKTVVC